MRDKAFLIEMGNRIKSIREAKGLTMRELGKQCSLDYSNICRIEGGQMSSHILTLKRIADALGVSAKDFI